MSKRYYYTDAIVALYMMKEFGVKYDFFMRKIYVGKESQKIFKFKKSDLVKYGFGSIDFYNQISQKNSVSEIIYRDGKQFFMPEVEK